MQIEVKGLGTVDYEEDELLVFEEGLYGFDHLHKYLPVPFEESDRIFILQSVEEPLISFVLMNPFMIIDDYNPFPFISDLNVIGNPDIDDVSFYVICSLKETLDKSTLNLKCPIIVNALNKKSGQIILDGSEYQLRHSLKDYENRLVKGG